VHELSIAEAVIGIVERHAQGRKVEKVELKVGHLRQVVPSALEFAFELVSEGTVAEGAELDMETVAAEGDCRECGAHAPLPAFPLMCGSCGSFSVDVTQGEELFVDSLELQEAALTTSGG
jgi:hydrogenase nickel incorporation protein HypA/HybF